MLCTDQLNLLTMAIISDEFGAANNRLGPCMRYLSNGVIKSSNTPAPSELPTRNQYKGMLELASRRLSSSRPGVAMAFAVNQMPSMIAA